MFKRLTHTLVLLSTLFTALPVRADSVIPPVQRLGTGIPTSIAASPDGNTLAVGSSIGVWLLNADTLQPFGFWDTGFWVNSVAYSADGKYVKANETVLDAGSGGKVTVEVEQIVWIDHRCTIDKRFCAKDFMNVDALASTQVIDMDTNVSKKILEWPVKDVAWSPDGAKLYDVINGDVKAWNTKTWQLSGHLGSFFLYGLEQVLWSTDGAQIASGEQIWDVNSGQWAGLRTCYGYGDSDSPCAPPIDAFLYWVVIYNRHSRSISHQFVPHHIALTALALSNDEKLIVTSGADTLRDCEDVKQKWTCSTSDTSTRIWDFESREQIAQFPVLFYDIAISPNNDVLVGHTQTDLQVWDWKSSTLLWRTDEDSGYHCSLYYYSDYYSCWGSGSGAIVNTTSEFVATYTSTGNTVHLYRLSNGELVATLIGHTALITDVAFSPDGSQIAASSGDGTILIWNVP